ncbi:TLC domain-containing protein 2-like [Amphiura filiformis]|uniref:TLC domain-containing protein 2-like n=1 Tax=Amphiura filiformis TaxID=82378 RepID=UPI003B21F339
MVSASACVVILSSFVTFSLFNKFLEFDIIPIPKRYVGNLQHKWRSATVSFVHATIVGVMSVFSLPTIWSDFVLNYTSIGEATIAVATGYTLYDIVNLFRTVKSKLVASLFLHHFIVAYFGLMFIHHQQLLGYGILCAVVETNSIFLHTRQLILMNDIPKLSASFRVNNMIYIISFVTVRVPAFLIMLIFFVWDIERMTAIWQFAMIPGTLGLLFVNVYLFFKLLFSDYLV